MKIWSPSISTPFFLLDHTPFSVWRFLNTCLPSLLRDFLMVSTSLQIFYFMVWLLVFSWTYYYIILMVLWRFPRYVHSSVNTPHKSLFESKKYFSHIRFRVHLVWESLFGIVSTNGWSPSEMVLSIGYRFLNLVCWKW
jgi:hypothetical protein